MDVHFALICQDNENIRNFSRELNRMERPKTVPRLTACPQVSVKIGDLRITLNLGGRRLESNLELINKCRNHEQLVDFSRRARIWRVSYRNNPMDDEYPGGGWCGYLAIDQIMRKAESPANIKVPDDQRLLAKSLKEIVKLL